MSNSLSDLSLAGMATSELVQAEVSGLRREMGAEVHARGGEQGTNLSAPILHPGAYYRKS